MITWEHERDAVLGWWPTLLVGAENMARSTLDRLEDEAWGCVDETDWKAWLDLMAHVWPQRSQVVSRLVERERLLRGGNEDDLRVAAEKEISAKQALGYGDRGDIENPETVMDNEEGEEEGDEGGVNNDQSGDGGELENAGEDGVAGENHDVFPTQPADHRLTGSRSTPEEDASHFKDIMDEVIHQEQSSRDRGDLEDHFGPSLGEALGKKMDSPEEPLDLPDPELQAAMEVKLGKDLAIGRASPGPSGRLAGTSSRVSGQHKGVRKTYRQRRSRSTPRAGALAAQLQKEFGLRRIGVAHTATPQWVEQQLGETRMGLAQIAMALGIEHESIGRGRLMLWFHENSTREGAHIGRRDQLEIHQHGGDVGRAWLTWVLRDAVQRGRIQPGVTASAWRRSWDTSAFMRVVRQRAVIDSAQQSLQHIQETVDRRADASERVFRRYRLACKWFDLVREGCDAPTLRERWKKVRMGNRIVWAGMGDDAMGIARQWTWEERLLDVAFFDPSSEKGWAQDWQVPSWARRSQAVMVHEWRSDLLDDPRLALALWAIGGEALLWERIGRDSWVASSHPCHPQEWERREFRVFFEEELAPFLFDE